MEKEQNVVKNEKESGFMFKIYEMKDSLEEGIKNANAVIQNQKDLVDVINVSDKETLKATAVEIEKTTHDYEKQIEQLEYKKTLCEQLITVYEDDENEEHSKFLVDVVSALLLLLGVVKPE